MTKRICELVEGDIFFIYGSYYIVSMFTEKSVIAWQIKSPLHTLYRTNPITIGKRSQQKVSVCK